MAPCAFDCRGPPTLWVDQPAWWTVKGQYTPHRQYTALARGCVGVAQHTPRDAVPYRTADRAVHSHPLTRSAAATCGTHLVALPRLIGTHARVHKHPPAVVGGTHLACLPHHTHSNTTSLTSLHIGLLPRQPHTQCTVGGGRTGSAPDTPPKPVRHPRRSLGAQPAAVTAGVTRWVTRVCVK